MMMTMMMSMMTMMMMMIHSNPDTHELASLLVSVATIMTLSFHDFDQSLLPWLAQILPEVHVDYDYYYYCCCS
jgi:hypothetical protein